MSDSTRSSLRSRRFSEDVRDTSGNIRKAVTIDLNNTLWVMVENAMAFLEGAVEKFKIALIIPKILGNPHTFKECIKNSKFSDCYVLVKKYLIEEYKEHMRQNQSTENVDDSNSMLEAYRKRFIDYLFKNTEILEVLPDWVNDLDDQEAMQLEAFRALYTIANTHLRRNVETAIKYENDVRNMYLERNMLEKAVEDIQNRLAKKKRNIHWQSLGKDFLERNIDLTKQKLTEAKNDILCTNITEANRRRREIDFTHVPQQEQLQEDLIKAKSAQVTLAKENRLTVKKAREARERLIIQIRDLMKKRDTSMLERFKTKLALMDEVAEESEKLAETKMEWEEVQREHHRIVGADELEPKFFRKYIKFRLTCAILKIQRWYREILAENKKKHKLELMKVKQVKKTTPVKVRKQLPPIKSAIARKMEEVHARALSISQVRHERDLSKMAIDSVSLRSRSVKSVAFRES